MGLSLTELLVEYLRSPLGLDEQAPRFSWQLSSDKKETLQTAAEIRVREGKTEEEVWDSGQLSTGVSTGIAYAGKELKPCTSYVVQVARSVSLHTEQLHCVSYLILTLQQRQR